MTQGKIERWHQTPKNRILLENYFLPDDLETQIDAFVANYNHLRYHKSINNPLTSDAAGFRRYWRWKSDSREGTRKSRSNYVG